MALATWEAQQREAEVFQKKKKTSEAVEMGEMKALKARDPNILLPGNVNQYRVSDIKIRYAPPLMYVSVAWQEMSEKFDIFYIDDGQSSRVL